MFVWLINSVRAPILFHMATGFQGSWVPTQDPTEKQEPGSEIYAVFTGLDQCHNLEDCMYKGAHIALQTDT